MRLFSSNRVLGCIAVLALVLIGCNQTGSLNTLSGALEPKSLEFEIQTNALEAQTKTQLNQTALTRVNLVNGQLQVNTFAAQKTSIATAVNGSSLWSRCVGVVRVLQCKYRNGSQWLEPLESDPEGKNDQ